jgi:hypothetical protein
MLVESEDWVVRDLPVRVEKDACVAAMGRVRQVE